MDSDSLALDSDRATLLVLRAGDRGVVVDIAADVEGRAQRLAALGVTPGAIVTVLQVTPGVILRCDETEVAIEPVVAAAVGIVRLP